MPYGLPKGHDTKKNNTWMERCVSSITGVNKRTGKPYKEDEKIAICKFNMKKHGWEAPSDESQSELSMREELYELEKKIRDAIMGPAVKETTSGPWVVDIFDDVVIVDNNTKMFKVPYSTDGDSITINWNNAVEVERKTVYEPVTASVKLPDIKDQYRRITWGTKTI